MSHSSPGVFCPPPQRLRYFAELQDSLQHLDCVGNTTATEMLVTEVVPWVPLLRGRDVSGIERLRRSCTLNRMGYRGQAGTITDRDATLTEEDMKDSAEAAAPAHLHGLTGSSKGAPPTVNAVYVQEDIDEFSD